MFCPYCGAKIKENLVECSYCKQNIHSSLIAKKIKDIELYNRISSINKLYGIEINEDYEKLSLKEIERYYDSLIKEYNNYEIQLSLEQKEKIEEHLERVHEENQKRYDIRKDALVKYEKKFVNDYSFVNFLLNELNPPNLNAAAFKIRSSCERQLIDFYKFKYICKNGKQKFEKTYFQMFHSITKDKNVAKFLLEFRRILNYYIHECKKNDVELKKMFPRVEDAISYLNKGAAEFRKYKLIK